MKLAFSTLGCPGAPIEEVIGYGFAGVELRCATGELLSPDASDRTARRIGARLAEAGVRVVCLSTYVQAGIPDDGVEESLARHIELADQVGAPFVRVFGGEPGDPGVTDRAAARLAASAPLAEESGVTVLLETHDALLTGRAVAAALDRVGSPAVGAVWDVVNPWRAGEPLAETADVLRPWLRHVQAKDVASPGDLAPVVPGTGTVPLEGFVSELARIGYDGWVSLEWEAAWYPQAPALAEALPAFRALMRERVR